MKYSELLDDAKRNLSKEQILASDAVRTRVNRSKQQTIRPIGEPSIAKIRLMRKFMRAFLDDKIPKPKPYALFNINDVPSHNLPCRLLVEHQKES